MDGRESIDARMDARTVTALERSQQAQEAQARALERILAELKGIREILAASAQQGA